MRRLTFDVSELELKYQNFKLTYFLTFWLSKNLAIFVWVVFCGHFLATEEAF